MRALILVLIALALVAGGCLQAGEPIEANDAQPEPAGAPDDTAPPSNATAARSGTNETGASPEANDTEPPNATDGTDANTTSDPSAEPVRLPGNLSMEAGEVLERSSERVKFRWKGATGPTSTDPGLAVRTLFDVPAGVPLTINATLTWSDASDLDLFVDGEDVDHYCSSTTPADPGLGGGAEACSVRTFARSSWDAWGVRVGGSKLGQDAAPRPANFTVELAIAVAEPWTGPPVEAPEPAGEARSDPGWPAIADAEIRPGVKVGVAGSGVNAGTGNFVFSSPDNRTLYVGWVAHGVDGMEPGDAVELPTAGVEATLVYCSWGLIEETVTCPELERAEHPLRRNDFALLRLPADARSTVHPATPLWGGPTGVGQPPATGDRLLGFGNTPYRDGGQTVNALDAFSGLATKSDRIQTEAYILPQPLPGDSGSPAMTADGQATGIVVGIGTPVDGTVAEPSVEPKDGSTILTNLANAVAVMENETALDVELKTWPLFDTPRAEDLAGLPASP